MGRQGESRRARLTWLRRLAVLATSAVVLAGCDDPNATGAETSAPTSAGDDRPTPPRARGFAHVDADLRRRVLEFHADLARATYLDAAERADPFRRVADVLAAEPAPDRLDAARQSWLATLPRVEQTRVFASIPGPVRQRARLWRERPGPVAAETLDRAVDAGIARETDAGLTTAALRDWHRRDSSPEIAGLYGLELLLWGADPSEDSRLAPFTTDPGADRRRRLVAASTRLLAEDLRAVADAWGASGKQRRALLDRPDPEALRQVVRAMRRTVAELVERPLRRSLEESSEFLPSRYAGRSLDALRNRLRGVANVYLGTYTRSDNSTVRGPGLASLVAALDPKLDRKLRSALSRALDAADRIPNPLRRIRRNGADSDALETFRSRIERVTKLVEKLEALGS